MLNDPDTVLILGGAGQDGRLLAGRLAQLGHKVVSLIRPNSISRLGKSNLALKLDLQVPNDFRKVYEEIRPTKIINFASLSSVALCESNPEKSKLINFDYAQNALEAAALYATNSRFPITFVQASSSEMYGEGNLVCDELSPMNPKTVYGVHKLMAHQFLCMARESSSNIKLKNMILFNHESELRPPGFVSQKIAIAVARVFLGKESGLKLGNTSSARDWGYAPDFMVAAEKILFAEESKDYVIATGQVHTIEKMLEHAFQSIGVADYKQHVTSEPSLFRKVETPPLIGNASKIREDLGWRPSTTFEEMVQLMVKSQIKNLEVN